MEGIIAQLMLGDTCFCPQCGSKIIMPLSNLDQDLEMQPRNDCCRDWYEALAVVVEETEREIVSMEAGMSEEESAEGLSALFG